VPSSFEIKKLCKTVVSARKVSGRGLAKRKEYQKKKQTEPHEEQKRTGRVSLQTEEEEMKKKRTTRISLASEQKGEGEIRATSPRREKGKGGIR